MSQRFVDSSGQDTLKKQSIDDMIEMGGYARGVFYLGDNNDQADVSSGYGEAALKLRIIPDKKISLFTEFRLRGGYEYGDPIFRPELRELYTDVSLGKFDLRLGHQIVSWGRADGINPTDNLTPKNYFVRSPESDDMRLANYLFLGRYRLTHNIRLEGIWVPFYRYSLYRFNLFDMPDFVTIKNPGNLQWEPAGGNTGLKMDFLFPSVDGSVSWFSGFDPQPGIDILSLSMNPTGLSLDLGAQAFRHNTFGVDFATMTGTFGIRGEAALRIPTHKYIDEVYTPKTDLRYVLEIDRSFGNFSLMLQYIGQWVPDFTDMPVLMLFDDSGELPIIDSSTYYLIPGILKQQISGFNRLIYGQTHRVSHTVSCRPSVTLLHSTLNAEIYGMYNTSTEELTIMPKISYSINDDWKISVGGQYFSGPKNTLNDMVGTVFNSGYIELKRSF